MVRAVYTSISELRSVELDGQGSLYQYLRATICRTGWSGQSIPVSQSDDLWNWMVRAVCTSISDLRSVELDDQGSLPQYLGVTIHGTWMVWQSVPVSIYDL